MTVLRSWSWLPSKETMQQMAKKATAVYVESVEDLRGSPPHVDYYLGNKELHVGQDFQADFPGTSGWKA